MSGDAFVASISPWRIAAAIMGCAGFVALGIFLIRIGDGTMQVAGGLAIVTFGTFAAFGAKRLTQRGPMVRIDAAGIWWRGHGDWVLEWREIVAFDEVRMNGQRFVAIHVVDADRLPPRLRRLSAINRGIGVGDLSIAVAGTDRRFDDLFAALVRFAPRDAA